MSTTKEFIDGLRRGEKSKENSVQVEHVKTHRTEKDKKEMSQIEKLQGGRHRKAQALPLPKYGTKAEERSQRHSESGSKKRKLQRKSGSGKEISSRTLSVKANGIGPTSV